MRSPLARSAALLAIALPIALLTPATFALWSDAASVSGVTITVGDDDG